MPASTPISSLLIANPHCPKCGAYMLLIHLLAVGPQRDQRIYECSRCDYEVTEWAETEKACPAPVSTIRL